MLTVQAATLNVPAQYPTIQVAVNAAASGDTIQVAAGTYPENVSITAKDLAITGMGDGTNPLVDTIVDGSQSGSVFSISGTGTFEPSVTFSGIRIQNGKANQGGGIDNPIYYAAVMLTNCTLSGNSATDNGGRTRILGAVMLTNCTLSGNSAGGDGGGLGAGAPVTLTNCTLSGNSAHVQGGALWNYDTATLTNCTICGNTASGPTYSYGGGIFNFNGGTLTLTNCTLSGNSATSGGGYYTAGGGIYTTDAITLTNCTLSGNSARAGGGIDTNGGAVGLTNCILWGDPGGELSVAYSTPTVAYSDVQGGLPAGVTDGGHDLNTDPLFLRNPGPTGSGDYGDLHLQPGSPCINAGNPAAVTAPPFLTNGQGTIIDLDGNSRVVCGMVDIGAFESQYQPLQITCPPNVTASTGPQDTGCATVVNGATLGTATACGGRGTVTVSRSGVPPGSIFPVGTTTITYTATDQSNGSVSCTQTVTVNDNTPPSITCPSNITVGSDPGKCSAVVTFSVTATDICPGAVNVVSTPASGSVFPVGATTVNSVATDAAGNTSTCSFTVTVKDTQSPTINCPSAPVSASATTCQGAIPTITATDNCQGAVNVTQTPAAGTMVGIGATLVSVTATDASGNVSTTTCSIVVADTTPPTVTATSKPQSTKVSSRSTSVSITGTVTDACSGVNLSSGTYSVTNNVGAPTQSGVFTISSTGAYSFKLSLNASSNRTYTITVNARDKAGNIATAQTTFKVGTG